MKFLWYISVVCFLVSCNATDDGYVPVDDNPLLEFTVPPGFPEPTYDLSINPPTEKGFQLGKRLFYDGRLASDGVVSCGFCHIQSFSFTHHTHIVSHGVNGALGTRNAQPLHNMAFMKDFTWDGAAEHLDEQPIIPITSPVEMNNDFNTIIATLKEDEEYVAMFDAAFENGEITADNMLKAISQFLVMMVSADSKYDRVLSGDGTTLTQEETEGLALFEQKCSSCHAGILFTDQTYRNNGLPLDPQYNDIGRKRVTGLDSDLRKFKVPTLRNIEATYPYMHDGRLQTLEDVLDHYETGMVDSPTLDEQFRQEDGTLGIPLTEGEKTKIIAFLKTLTDNNFIFDERFSEF